MSEDVAELDGERLAWMYRQMLRIREFEERVKATFTEHPGVIRGQGQVVLCFFGDGASKQGAFAESLNVASLWKLPVVYVLENNAYNVVTRVEQEDANAAAGGVPRRGGIRGGAAGRSLAAPVAGGRRARCRRGGGGGRRGPAGDGRGGGVRAGQPVSGAR
jgi:hypothetical protein